jgi:hypothetical protein
LPITGFQREVVDDTQQYKYEQMPDVGDPPVQHQANQQVEAVDDQIVYDRGANPPTYRRLSGRLRDRQPRQHRRRARDRFLGVTPAGRGNRTTL